MPHKYHAFVCVQKRPPGHPKGCCTSRGGGQPFYEKLVNEVNARNLGFSGVGVSQATCLGFCQQGPLIVVYPEGVWYKPASNEDVDEIIQSHFVEGKVVERLVVQTPD